MAARVWRLPEIQELSKEQERARMLPMDGCHLIVGGPGTGKSVVALLRVRRHHRDQGGQRYVFLAYNRLLLEASRELVDGAVNADTWIRRFKSIFRYALARDCPVKDGLSYAIDWEGVNSALESASAELRPPITPYIVIDEGQDMPKAFYKALLELGYEHFYVVADQNQQITEENSSLHDIVTSLAISAADRVVLTENYRNCDRVARLALAFCVPDPATPPVTEPRNRPCSTPVLVDYGQGCRLSFETVIERLLKLVDRDPERLIGVLTPTENCRRRWLDALRQAVGRPALQLDHGAPRIVTYSSKEPDGDHRFSLGGIFVINAQAAKGLEFDSVFLADIDQYPCHLEDETWMDSKRRLFYVMISRARDQVILLRQAGRPCPIEAVLPSDEGILRRWR